MVPHLAGNAGSVFRLVGAEKGLRRVSAIVQGNECEGLAGCRRSEKKTRPAWGSGPGKGRNLEMFGCYLFFLAFFFAGMFSPSCLGVA